MIAKPHTQPLPGDLHRATRQLEQHISHATEILSASIIEASGIFKASPRTLASPVYSRAALAGASDASARDWLRRLMPTLVIVVWFAAVAGIISATSPGANDRSTVDKSSQRLPTVSVHPPGVHAAEDLVVQGRPESL